MIYSFTRETNYVRFKSEFSIKDLPFNSFTLTKTLKGLVLKDKSEEGRAEYLIDLDNILSVDSVTTFADIDELMSAISESIFEQNTVGAGSSTTGGEVITSTSYQTQYSTLSYANVAVEGESFTHSANQLSAANAGNVFIEDLNIVRSYLGNGFAYVKISGVISTYVEDDPFTLTLPTGTLNIPFVEDCRAFRPVLNVTAYILLDVTPDLLTFNRDNQIDGNDPCYFKVEGIGNWIGIEPNVTSVVEPSSINDFKDTLYFATNPVDVNTSGLTLTLDNGLTWQDVIDTYQSIEVTFADSGIVRGTVVAPTSQLSNISQIGISAGSSSSVGILGFNLFDGNFTYDHDSVVTGDFLTIIGIK